MLLRSERLESLFNEGTILAGFLLHSYPRGVQVHIAEYEMVVTAKLINYSVKFDVTTRHAARLSYWMANYVRKIDFEIQVLDFFGKRLRIALKKYFCWLAGFAKQLALSTAFFYNNFCYVV